MNKILLLLSSLFFASISIAENEVVYDAETGSIEIPVLSIKGQTGKRSVTLQQQGTEDLIFALVDSVSNPIVDFSKNSATYDSETGIVYIPTVIILGKEDQPVKMYSVVLQENETLTFEITQMQNKLLLSNYKSASKSTWCTGTPDQNLSAAKANFRTKCGVEWSGQKGHTCNHKPDGFHCNGNGSTPTETQTIIYTPNPDEHVVEETPSNHVPAHEETHPDCYFTFDPEVMTEVYICRHPPEDNSPTTRPPTTTPIICSGFPSRNLDVAKDTFRIQCGDSWDYQRDRCDWRTDGWQCSGLTGSF